MEWILTEQQSHKTQGDCMLGIWLDAKGAAALTGSVIEKYNRHSSHVSEPKWSYVQSKTKLGLRVWKVEVKCSDVGAKVAETSRVSKAGVGMETIKQTCWDQGQNVPALVLTSLCSTSSLVNSMASSLKGSATCMPPGVFLELRGHSIPGQRQHNCRSFKKDSTAANQQRTPRCPESFENYLAWKVRED